MSVEVARLSNGLRVVTDRMDSVETVSVGTWIDIGTRDEDAAVNGVSHLLEHMAFKGTRKRSAYAIAAEIEAVGGHLNAYTSREQTAYYAKVLENDVDLAVDLLADILQHSTLEEDELDRERTVIIQEILLAQDTPDDIVFDYFQETAYPDQAMGRPVLGSVDLIRNISRDTVMDYMRDNYSAPRMIVAAAGKVDHDALVKLVEQRFDSLPAHSDTPRQDSAYTGGRLFERRELEQAHLLLGFDGVSYLDPDFYTASVLSTVLGGGMSSRLFQEIREKRGMVYAIYSFLSCYTDCGLLGIYAGTDEEQAAKLVPLICEEIAKVAENVGGDEIARAKAQLKASMLMALESTSSRSEQIARQLSLYGRPVPVDEIVEMVEAVDETAVIDTASRIFSTPRTEVVLGPVNGLDS